jgi:hypothetical protein
LNTKGEATDFEKQERENKYEKQEIRSQLPKNERMIKNKGKRKFSGC